MLSKVTVFCNNESRAEQAKDFAQRHGFNYSAQLPVATAVCLDLSESIPELCDQDLKDCIHIDFTAGGLAHRLKFGGGKGQTIAKAIGVTSKNKPHVLDATAGLGRDALVLANLGCKLTLIEQSPVLALMLKTACQHASDYELFQQATVAGFDVYNTNALSFMQQQQIATADVVYLDPMYPESKKSALVKKDMQLLQKMLGHSSEEGIVALLKAALDFAQQRVVVKRPKSASPIEGPAPTLSLSSKKTRYDIYVIKALATNND